MRAGGKRILYISFSRRCALSLPFYSFSDLDALLLRSFGPFTKRYVALSLML